MTPICIPFAIAGVAYGDYKLAPDIKIGDTLTFIGERTNKFDKNAIRIDWREVKLGYVPKGGYQDLFHEYHNGGIALIATIKEIGEDDSRPWEKFTVSVKAEKTLSQKIHELELATKLVQK